MTDEAAHVRPENPYKGCDRRKCADNECQVARSDWSEHILMPAIVEEIKKNEDKLWLKMKIQVAAMIGGTVIFCAALFQYMSTNAIRDYDLVARDKYTTMTQHQVDMNRIEQKIVSVETSVTKHIIDMREEISNTLDRNFEAIKMSKPR